MTTAARGHLRFTGEQIGQANIVNLLELARQYGLQIRKLCFLPPQNGTTS
jgi:hypothetical protein